MHHDRPVDLTKEQVDAMQAGMDKLIAKGRDGGVSAKRGGKGKDPIKDSTKDSTKDSIKVDVEKPKKPKRTPKRSLCKVEGHNINDCISTSKNR